MIWRDHVFNFGPKLATRVTKFREKTGEAFSRNSFFLKIFSPLSPIFGHNWKHDLARSCFILKTARMNGFFQPFPYQTTWYLLRCLTLSSLVFLTYFNFRFCQTETDIRSKNAKWIHHLKYGEVSSVWLNSHFGCNLWSFFDGSKLPKFFLLLHSKAYIFRLRDKFPGFQYDNKPTGKKVD